MPETITAIVENGMLRPTAPLHLADGTRVKLQVTPQEPPVGRTEPDERPISQRKSPAEIMAAIAALPMEPGPEFSGRDHDKILYGEHGAR
jgi:predicted DNA-binding antitoxin AbrB/MazE fold protein